TRTSVTGRNGEALPGSYDAGDIGEIGTSNSHLVPVPLPAFGAVPSRGTEGPGLIGSSTHPSARADIYRPSVSGTRGGHNMSRGFLLRLNSRTRKSITLTWVVLFILSLLLQYTQFAAPKSALANVGGSTFELDGNIAHSTSHDWDQVYADSQNGTSTSGADNIQFITDLVNTTADDIFTGGGSKDQQLLQGGPWLWTTSKPQPKDDIIHAFA